MLHIYRKYFSIIDISKVYQGDIPLSLIPTGGFTYPTLPHKGGRAQLNIGWPMMCSSATYHRAALCGDKREGDTYTPPPPSISPIYQKKHLRSSRESNKQPLQEAYIIWDHSRSKKTNFRHGSVKKHVCVSGCVSSIQTHWQCCRGK